MDVTRLDEEHALIPRREVELHQRIEEEADRFIHELRVIVPDTKVVLEERGGQPEDEFIVSPAEPHNTEIIKINDRGSILK